MLADDFFQNIPDNRLLSFDHFARLFNCRGVRVAFEFVVDKRFEKFQSHFLRQTALVQFEFRSDDDHRTSRIIHTFSEKILTKTTLFSFQSSRKRFERTIIRAAQNSPASAVIEQSVNCFLQHSLFIANDNFRCAQFNQFFQTIVSVDNAAV